MKPIVGEGLDPPETFHSNVVKSEANDTFPKRYAMVIDHPYGRDDCFLSTVPDIGNARHSAGGSQWRLANHRLCLFLERCCMGVVNQIKDLDNSSKPFPYKYAAAFPVRGCSPANNTANSMNNPPPSFGSGSCA